MMIQRFSVNLDLGESPCLLLLMLCLHDFVGHEGSPDIDVLHLSCFHGAII